MPELRGTIVLATYNSGASVGPVLAEIEEAASVLNRSGIVLEVLLVDDSSPDNTAAIASDEAARLGLKLEVLTGSHLGLGGSQLAGFEHLLRTADRDFFVTLDPDGHHDARQITDVVRMFVARRSGVTIGSRWVRGGSSPGTSALRSVVSRTANLLARRIIGLHGVHDATTSFRIIQPDVARLWIDRKIPAGGYGYFTTSIAVAQAAGFSVTECPITFRPRYAGVRSISFSDVTAFWRSLHNTRVLVATVRDESRRDQATWAARSPRMQAQQASSNSQFGAAAELENLAHANNFFGWIADELSPHLGLRILEVGAGIGTVAAKMADRKPASEITAIEPAENLFDQLQTTTKRLRNVTPLQLTSQELASTRPQQFDSIVYINVLEHILDDAAEMRTAFDLVAPGGSLGVFVPAMSRLYGSLDFKSGHHRRYDKARLREVVADAGFEIVELRYLEVAGVAPYWLMYHLLDRQSLSSMSSGIFDRVVVPVSKMVQRLVPNPPFGKNLLVIARRR
ncbi:MAG: bifunctional glycosyltransferase/class I SAM-dependent methyltransferase [Ilumatobacteraceae bacterium]